MALVTRNHNPFAHVADTLYMIIDKTKLEDIKVVKIGSMRRVQLLGALLAAEGKSVIAPPIEGRGFSKLSQIELQYLYWNTCGKAPSQDYAALIQECMEVIKQTPPADDHIASLEYLVAQLEPGVVKVEGESGAPEVPQRPKATTTTGVIWAICDEVLQALHEGVLPTDFKALRAEAWKRCDAEGFNSGTFGVQYGKWKNNKLGVAQK